MKRLLTLLFLLIAWPAYAIDILTMQAAGAISTSNACQVNFTYDTSGNNTGFTPFSAFYFPGSSVTAVAPATCAGRSFKKWQLGNTDLTTSTTANITTKGTQTLTAVYYDSYYVSTTGDDSRTCTQAKDITTPLRALNSSAKVWTCVTPDLNDHVIVRGGSYSTITGLLNPFVVSTSYIGGVYIQAYPGETVWTIGLGFNTGAYKYVTVDGIGVDQSLSGPGADWTCTTMGDTNGDHAQILNFEFKNCSSHGVSGGAGFINFVNGSVHDTGSQQSSNLALCVAYGFYWSGHDSLFDNVTIYNDSGYGVHQFNSNVTNVSNNTWRNLRVFGNGGAATNLANGDPCNGGSSHYGVLLSSGSNNALYNSLIYANTRGVSVGGCPNCIVENNTIYTNTKVGTTSGAQPDSGIVIADGTVNPNHSSGTVVRNNIVFGQAINGISTSQAPLSSLTIDHNLCDSAATGCSVTGDPLLVAYTTSLTSDLHIQTGSPAKDAGATLSNIPASDKDGTSRPQGSAWDIGGYEFIQTPTPFTLTVGSTNPSNGVTFILSSPSSTPSTPYSNTYNSGTALTLTASASAGANQFISWTGCDTVNTTTCNVTMTTDKTVVAHYGTLGPLRVGVTNPRYFRDTNNNPVYLTGSYDSCFFQDNATVGVGTFTNCDFNAQIAFLVSHGHNFMRIFNDFGQSSGSSAAVCYTPQPYTLSSGTSCASPQYDLNTFNQAYFDRLSTRVQAAANAGIYVSVMLFDGWDIDAKGLAHDGWLGHPYKLSNNINSINGDCTSTGNGLTINTLTCSAVTTLQEFYIKKIVDTLNAFDNVIFEVANEDYPSAAHTTWAEHVMSYLRNYEATNKPKQHLIGFTIQWSASTGFGLNSTLTSSTAEWISPDNEAGQDYSADPPANPGTKIIIADTDHLSPRPSDYKWVWKSFTRGVMPILLDDGFPVNANKEAIRAAMGSARSFAQKMDLTQTVPLGSISSTAYALSHSGVEYLIYQPGTGAFTATVVAGNYVFEWFNPQTNLIDSAGNVVGTGSAQTFTPPFSGDAVLFLKNGFALTVASQNPASGVSMTVNTPDLGGLTDGTTQFVRNYVGSPTVTVTAAAFDGSHTNTFDHWDGCDSSNGAVCNTTVNSDKTITATYATPTVANRVLTVNSSNPVSNVPIILSPNNNGLTSFTQSYTDGTTVVATANCTSLGPIARWNFEEGSGTTAADSTCNGHTMSLQAPTWVSGIHGNAVSFNGTTSSGFVTTDGWFNLSGQFTVAVAVKPGVSLSGFSAIISKGPSGSASTYHLYASTTGLAGCASGSPAMVFTDSTDTDHVVCDNGNALATGSFTILVAVKDATTLKLYRKNNGGSMTLIATTTTSATVNQSTGNILIASSEFGELLNGVLDDLVVAPRAWTSQEVTDYGNNVFSNGNNFSNWTCPSGTASSYTCSYTSLNADRTITANYLSVQTLTISSVNPASGVSITGITADLSNVTSCSTPCTLTYNNGTSVSFTGPATAGSNTFNNWAGADSVGGTGNRTATLAMTTDRTATVTYNTPGAACTTSVKAGSVSITVKGNALIANCNGG